MPVFARVGARACDSETRRGEKELQGYFRHLIRRVIGVEGRGRRGDGKNIPVMVRLLVGL